MVRSTESPMQRWMKLYAASLGFVEPFKVAEAVWQCSEAPCPSWSLDDYGARVLLPLAHALIDNWKGRDSITAFSIFARRFGLQSLEYISWLQVNGLDQGYGDALRDVMRDDMDMYAIAQEFVDRRGRALWMACAAGYDVLHDCLPRGGPVSPAEQKGVRLVISNARFLAENISSDGFQYLSPAAREGIGDEAEAILEDFGEL